MSSAKREALLAKLSPSARNALQALAKTPGDAVQFYHRITIQHAALMLGREVVELSIQENPADPAVPVKGAIANTLLAITTGYECAMTLLRDLYSEELAASNLSKPPGEPLPPKQENRLRKLDLD